MRRRPALSSAVGALAALAAGGVLAVGVVPAVGVVGTPGAQAAPAPATGAPSSAACTVTDATLTWGVKESFRSYISGSIAKGSWETAGGATYATPSFAWSAGTGSLVAGAGDVAFTGSVRFTGHQGVLDTTVADPTLRITSPTTAELLLDVSGTTQEGEAVRAVDVPFASVDLTATPVSGDATGTVSIVDAPVTLTDAGAAAFGTYPAGTALDPVDLTVPVTCAEPEPEPEPSATPTADVAPAADVETTPAAASAAASGDDGPSAGTTAGIAAAATGWAAALIAAAVLIRRRRASSAALPGAADSGTGTTPSTTDPATDPATDPEEPR